MTNFLNYALITLIVLVIAALVMLGWQALRRPVLAKIGLRNIPRRPTQSILIVVGLTLSTVIIISALATGDTLNYSVQRQAVGAFGEVDEIVAPPLLSALISLGSGPEGEEEASNEQFQQLEDLSAGGLTSVLAILEGGLPGITMDRYAELRAAAEQEPLIDGVAGSILFPTIIRNQTTGQGEPLGFVFAVDQDYDQQFGITTVTGQSVTMDALQPGVGNIFAQAANVFSMAQSLAARAGLSLDLSDAVLAVAGLGAVLTGGVDDTGEIDLAELSLSTETLASLGVDTTPLEAQGIYSVTLESLGITTETLQSFGVVTTTIQPNSLMSNTLGLDTGQIVSATNNLLSSFNLNTLGQEIDRALAPFGLQLRQGDVYLSRLGAAKLDANVGDVLEIFVGPIPIPVRVKAIVEEAGPVSALLPTVMMPLEEAQKLFFMQGKVNNILVSNLGDELTGMEHTAAVSDRLRVLAMDEAALERIVAILRRPDIQPLIERKAASYQDEFFGDPGEEGPPAFIVELFQDFSPFGEMFTQLQSLPPALAEPGISPALRAALANTMVRAWLLDDAELPRDAQSELQAAFSTVNQFDVIDGLNKQTVVTAANVGGSIFSSIFTLFGTFSILAAIMLIFLIFVMLAAERRVEMGIARAIGVQRSHLVQMFVTEGMVYDLLAAALGVGLGLAVSYGMIGFLDNLAASVSALSGDVGVLQFRFNVAPTSIVIGYCLGVLITYLVVTWSSWRVSRLNIVAAIRDLPEESNRKRLSLFAKIRNWLLGPILIAAGVALIQQGASNLTYWQIGLTFASFGVLLLLGQVLGRTQLRDGQISRIVYSGMGLTLLLAWGVPWNAVLGRTTSEIFQNDQFWALLSFAVTGPLLIIGAILVLMFNADLLTWLISRIFGRVGALTPVLKTAIAYPLSTRFRTGMTMTLFAMIIATVVIMALVIQATQTLVVLDDKQSGGFEIKTSNTLLSFFNPLRDLEAELPRSVEQYPHLADVAIVGSVAQQDIWVRPAGSDWRLGQLTGSNAGYWQQAEQVYELQARAAGFADDAAVWQALRERTDVAIVSPNLFRSDEVVAERIRFALPESLLANATLPDLFVDVRAGSFDTLNEAPLNDAPGQRVQIIGVLAEDTTLAGGDFQANLGLITQLTGEAPSPDNFYIKAKAGADLRTVQQEVERAFLGNGINVTVMAEDFAVSQNLIRGILSLFQGFMALGLLVGIAALGVISVRTVVERRQQIGVLRAIGFQSNMVALSLVLEASFIALAGLLIGTGTGILLGESLIRTTFLQLTPETPFVIPWAQLGLILLVAYGFALLTTIIPAYQAARIYPAEALRYE